MRVFEAKTNRGSWVGHSQDEVITKLVVDALEAHDSPSHVTALNSYDEDGENEQAHDVAAFNKDLDREFKESRAEHDAERDHHNYLRSPYLTGRI